MGDDMISSEEEEGWDADVTLTVPREPVAASANGGWDAKWRGNAPTPRTCAVSSIAIGEREAKRKQSPRSSEASPALSPPATGMAR